MEQAYQGMLSAIERKGSGAALDALQAKTAMSELAESTTQRLCRILGGATFHRASHFGAAFEDVRALGRGDRPKLRDVPLEQRTHRRIREIVPPDSEGLGGGRA